MKKNKSPNALDNRMKRYEAVTNISLMRRTPVILRFDMCHGHTFTRGFDKPFDKIFMKSMQETMLALCKDIEGAVFGYTQSDEITVVLVDYKNLESAAWFDNRLEKLCSVGASKATRFFNKFYIDNVGIAMSDSANADVNFSKYTKNFFGAEFDLRAFNIPKEEVCNNIVWRQNDATKNSISSLAQSMFSQKELNGLSKNDMQDKMFTEKGVNWNDCPTDCKRGSSAIKNEDGKWVIDYDMPIVSKNREYVERFVYVGE